jgi:hypothetical protein
MIPTIEQVMKCYQSIAQTERMKTGRPGEETVANALRGTVNVCRSAHIELTSPVTSLTRKKIDIALASFVERGLTRISAWSYVWQLKSVFARWCMPYYKDAGWEIPPLDIPSFRAKAPHYIRPSVEMLSRVKAWYKKQTGEHWFAATMMLEFAMRNSDVLRLKDTNFIEKDSGHYLSYTPHKTELSSGRRVYWPIHEDIWERFMEYGGLEGLDVTDETFSDINYDLRALGFRGTKGAYELRKICIDHVYQKFGAEMAVSISGDEIRTISKYYADPAQPNLGTMRILDLI